MTQKLLHNIILGYEHDAGICLSKQLVQELASTLNIDAKPGVSYRGGLLTSSPDPRQTLSIVIKYLNSPITQQTKAKLAGFKKTYVNYPLCLAYKQEWMSQCMDILTLQIGKRDTELLFKTINSKYHHKIYSLTKILQAKI